MPHDERSRRRSRRTKPKPSDASSPSAIVVATSEPAVGKDNSAQQPRRRRSSAGKPEGSRRRSSSKQAPAQATTDSYGQQRQRRVSGAPKPAGGRRRTTREPEVVRAHEHVPFAEQAAQKRVASTSQNRKSVSFGGVPTGGGAGDKPGKATRDQRRLSLKFYQDGVEGGEAPATVIKAHREHQKDTSRRTSVHINQRLSRQERKEGDYSFLDMDNESEDGW